MHDVHIDLSGWYQFYKKILFFLQNTFWYIFCQLNLQEERHSKSSEFGEFPKESKRKIIRRWSQVWKSSSSESCRKWGDIKWSWGKLLSSSDNNKAEGRGELCLSVWSGVLPVPDHQHSVPHLRGCIHKIYVNIIYINIYIKI